MNMNISLFEVLFLSALSNRPPQIMWLKANGSLGVFFTSQVRWVLIVYILWVLIIFGPFAYKREEKQREKRVSPFMDVKRNSHVISSHLPLVRIYPTVTPSYWRGHELWLVVMFPSLILGLQYKEGGKVVDFSNRLSIFLFPYRKYYGADSDGYLTWQRGGYLCRFWVFPHHGQYCVCAASEQALTMRPLLHWDPWSFQVCDFQELLSQATTKLCTPF